MSASVLRGRRETAGTALPQGVALSADLAVQRGEFRLEAALTVPQGEVTAIMGPSGAGKSTLLAAIAGAVRLTSGRIQLADGAVVTRRRHLPTAKRGVVMLGQDARLFPHLSVRDNVAFGLVVRGLAKDRARQVADEWLWRVGLSGSGPNRPRELSGGQQQRVALARALAVAPRLLLLDEPLTGLDAETAADTRAVLHEQLSSTRTTALVVTHDAFDAAALARQVVVIEGGRVMQRGAVRRVLETPATQFVAAVAGLNRVRGAARDGLWRAAGVDGDVRVAAAAPVEAPDATPLVAVFRPADVRLARAGESTWTGAVRVAHEDPHPVGEWLGKVTRLEPTPGGARVHTTKPDVVAEVPAAQLAALALAPGDPVRLALDPADVRLLPDE
ncbi:sulfate/molybdate ABC transporter ATP-binding protein [Microbacterium sp. JZ31]|uniref:sulfate/molybdate ABC transporter ATP-binding protein n=1 Tax=Microbacterium sp. JZ31 TaxID=1906274 RepID=UPI001EE4BDBD|nr:ABC transporter ATP-binding protein [Microbacterium sp. JZ31]